MASPQESVSMALFCDFENVALGVRDANYEKFDIKPVLERLLLKGSIVVKKAYCDWDRYKGFKAAMHEASFELIEIPHVRVSGKNSADIRLVVDALDLCYTKLHVDTFVIISGDSDFSPLVSKLRENAKRVIGVGVKNSTSDLLVANCDEFIFYDDLVREQQRTIAKREANAANKRATPADDEKQPKHEIEARKAKAFAIAVETFDALVSERGDSGKIWASILKNAIKRRKPDFNESYYGFRAFGNLLDEAQARGLLEVGRDEKSGAFVYRSGQAGVADGTLDGVADDSAPVQNANGGNKPSNDKNRRKNRGGRDAYRQVDGAVDNARASDESANADDTIATSISNASARLPETTVNNADAFAPLPSTDDAIIEEAAVSQSDAEGTTVPNGERKRDRSRGRSRQKGRERAGADTVRPQGQDGRHDFAQQANGNAEPTPTAATDTPALPTALAPVSVVKPTAPPRPPSQAFRAPYEAPAPVVVVKTPQAPLFDDAHDVPAIAASALQAVESSPAPPAKRSPARRARSAAVRKAEEAVAEALKAQEVAPASEASAVSANAIPDAAAAAKPVRAARKSVAGKRRAAKSAAPLIDGDH